MNTPKRGIGPATEAALQSHADKNEQTLREAMREADRLGLGPKVTGAILGLAAILDAAALKAATDPALAAFLRGHPRVHAVSYPEGADSPYAASAERYLPRGPGLDHGIPHHGRPRGRPALHRGLRAVLHLANVGDAKTLVIHPASTTHRRLDEAALAAGGVTDDMIRVSVGLEDIDDIVWDVERALAASA